MTTAVVPPAVLQRRRNFVKNQAGVAQLKRSPLPTVSTPPEEDDAPACGSCRDTKVDRFGFDCVECL